MYRNLTESLAMATVQCVEILAASSHQATIRLANHSRAIDQDFLSLGSLNEIEPDGLADNPVEPGLGLALGVSRIELRQTRDDQEWIVTLVRRGYAGG